MKFLLDENIPATIKKTLKSKGYDVEHANDKLKGKKDREVFEYAVKNKRCIITYDCDFNEFNQLKHYGIIKIEQITDRHQDKLLEVIEQQKVDGFEDIFIHITRNKVFKITKVFSKKNKFKHFRKVPLELLA